MTELSREFGHCPFKIVWLHNHVKNAKIWELIDAVGRQNKQAKRSSKSTYSSDGCPDDLAVLTRKVEALKCDNVS